MEQKFSPEKIKQDRWERAILIERNHSPQSLLIKTLDKITHHDSALILGDACKVNSKYLIEQEDFKSVDNVDASPLINDDYYKSEKLHNHQMLFGAFDFPENKYDFIYGKSITFLLPKLLEKTILKIENSLKKDGIFTSLWLLPENTTISNNNWEKDVIENVFKKTNLTIVSTVENCVAAKNLGGKEGISHTLTIVARK
jgi:hypothetical protein